MSRYVVCLLFLATAIATAQQPSRCVGRNGVPRDSLDAHARRLHPELSKPENQSHTVVVGLVYDNKCAVVRHALKRVGSPGGLEATLLAVFPDSSRLTMGSFEIGGFASLGGEPRRPAEQLPVIAWGLLTPRGIPR